MFSFDSDAKQIHLYSEIGPEWAGMVGPEAITEAFAAMGGDDVTMYLSSPGGSVDAGSDVFNIIERYSGKVTMIVDAIAASMGSYILQAADERVVCENSKLMIHDPWGVSIGNSTEFRKMADVLDKYALGMLPAYMEATGKTEDEVKKMMAEESWFVGQEIVDNGFADRVEGRAKRKIDKKSLARWARVVPKDIEEETAPFPLRAKFKGIAASL